MCSKSTRAAPHRRVAHRICCRAAKAAFYTSRASLKGACSKGRPLVDSQQRSNRVQRVSVSVLAGMGLSEWWRFLFLAGDPFCILPSPVESPRRGAARGLHAGYACAILITRAIEVLCHSPPRAVFMLRAFSSFAIPSNVVMPLAWIRSIVGMRFRDHWRARS